MTSYTCEAIEGGGVAEASVRATAASMSRCVSRCGGSFVASYANIAESAIKMPSATRSTLRERSYKRLKR